MRSPRTDEVAAEAARLVVEAGLEYGAAKAKAARTLARRGAARSEMPSNEQVEAAVLEHLAVYGALTHATELAALRRLALEWMSRLSAFRPYLTGAVWRGTATRQSAVHIDLYCDDPKSAEIALLELKVAVDVRTLGVGGPDAHDVLTVASPCPELGTAVTVHLHVRDRDDLRGALKPDASGRTWRGDAAAVARLNASADAA